MKKLSLSLAIVLNSFLTLFASHQAGHHMNMKWVSGDNYKFTLINYTDASGIQPPQSISFEIKRKSNNQLVQTLTMILNAGSTISLNDSNGSNCNSNVLMIRKSTYQATINLQNFNDTAGYYIIGFDNSRNNGYVNVDASGTTIVFKMEFPAVGNLSPFTHNSSPVITNDPVFNGSNGVSYFYDLQATDADGDSLVYSITEPLTTLNNISIIPLNFNPGFSLQLNVMNSLPSTDFVDNLTGNMVLTPTLIGLFLLTVKVEEYSKYPNIFKKGEIRIEFPIQVSPYGTNRMAYLDSFPTDTVKIQAGINTCFPVKGKLSQPGTIVMQASSADTIFGAPGAKFGLIPNAGSGSSISDMDSITGYFCWTPSYAAVRAGVYPIKIKIYDTFCVDLVKDSTTILVQVIDSISSPVLPTIFALSLNTMADPKIGTFAYSISASYPNSSQGAPQLFAYSRLLDSLSSRVSFNKSSEVFSSNGTLNWSVQCSDTTNSPYAVVFAAKNQASTSDSVAFLINFTVDSCKVSAIAELALSSLKIFPNPANNKLFVELNKNLTNVKMNVIDSRGKEVISTTSKQDFMNLENLQQGIYFIRIVANEGVVTRRFTVVR